jgi:hypothetical protein
MSEFDLRKREVMYNGRKLEISPIVSRFIGNNYSDIAIGRTSDNKFRGTAFSFLNVPAIDLTGENFTNIGGLTPEQINYIVCKIKLCDSYYGSWG